MNYQDPLLTNQTPQGGYAHFADLQVHPFNNSLGNLLLAMYKQKVDAICPMALNRSVFPEYVRQAQARYGDSNLVDLQCDDRGILIGKHSLLLNGREHNTREGLHVLSIGHSRDAEPTDEVRRVIDGNLENGALVLLDHPFVDNLHTRTAGHISEELSGTVHQLCDEYQGQIALEWNGYCIPWIRKGLQSVLNLFGHSTLYYDVNRQVEVVAYARKISGKHVQVVPTTDVHARTKGALSAMGTAGVLVNLAMVTPEEAFQHLKDDILGGNYKPIKETVTERHLLFHYCLPQLLRKLYTSPRAE